MTNVIKAKTGQLSQPVREIIFVSDNAGIVPALFTGKGQFIKPSQPQGNRVQQGFRARRNRP